MSMPSVDKYQIRHHLDRYADDLIDRVADGDEDELLETKYVARLIHTSIQWLEIGRSKGTYGPPYVRLGPRLVRYRRGDLVKWLRARSARPETSGGRSVKLKPAR